MTDDDTTIDDSVEQPIPDTDLPLDESLAGLPKATDDVKVPPSGGDLPERPA
jgi:hypothetical protein